MKVQEMRLGNTLQYGDDLITVDVNVLRDFDVYLKSGLKPIPLTEEILYDFGFVQFKGWDDMLYWCLQSEVNNADRFELLETLQGYESPSGKIIKEVHTLQNCYYFHTLTGEELTIKN